MVYHHEKNTIWGEFFVIFSNHLRSKSKILFLAPHRSRVCLCEPTRMGNGWVGPQQKPRPMSMCGREFQGLFVSVAQMRLFRMFPRSIGKLTPFKKDVVFFCLSSLRLYCKYYVTLDLHPPNPVAKTVSRNNFCWVVTEILGSRGGWHEKT